MNEDTVQFIEELKTRQDVLGIILFGSWARGNNRPDSDVDVMLAFNRNAHWSLFDIVDMKLELEGIFKRDVDILEEGTVRNPIKRRCIDENIEVVYESPR